MMRRAFNLAVGLSLMILVATLVLWVRSYRAGDNLNWFYATGPASNGPPGNRSGTQGVCQSEPGRLTLLISSTVDDAIGIGGDGLPRLVVTPEGFHFGTGPAVTFTNISVGPARHELALGPVYYSSGQSMHLLRVSDWTLVLGLLFLPILWLMRFAQRHERRASTHCSVCGYDLRATPDRCPECGTPTEAGVEA
jgi:hypothetical protein